MNQLTPDLLKEYVRLLAPFMGSALERHSLLDLAVGRLPIFDTLSFDSPTTPFITELANRLAEYGHLPEGDLALCCVLQVASEQSGPDNQTEFDLLIGRLNALDSGEVATVTDSGRMTTLKATPARLIRVFISSPGDVPEERTIAAKALTDLQSDPIFKGRLKIDVIAWDRPGAETPMLATLTPQEAINQHMALPADCDLVVVMFWTRMGTPLPPDYVKTTGERYQSGTEWEYLNAVESEQKSAVRGDNPSRPQIIVYRRMDEPVISLRDPQRTEKIAQWERVEAFFQAFTNPDGSLQHGYNKYTTPDEFRKQFEAHLKLLLTQILETPRATDVTDEAGSAPKIVWLGSPFPGLRAFTPDDEPIFYGRGGETDAVIEQLRNSRLVAIVGASGSGKSSLIGAGVLPRLTGNAITGSKDWLLPARTGEPGSRVWLGLRFTPGEVSADPFMALALRLAPLTGREARKLAADLADQPEALPQLMESALAGKPSWAEALLFIDQFEELFTLADQNKREPFIQMLKAATESPRLRIILTLRADFYVRCVENQTLSDLLKAGTFPLAAPGTVALSEMIARPAERAGLRFEGGLIDLILRETGDDPGALALLAYLLDEMYKQRTRDGRLTLRIYRELGGVQGAIGKRAEETVSGFKADQQAMLPALFREIVEVDARGEPTRRRADLNWLLQNAALADLIDKLTDARLLVRDEGAGGHPIVEVAHEALLRQWPRLSEWIVTAEADLRLRRQLEQAARDWESEPPEDRDAYALVGGRLIEAQNWQIKNGAEPEVAALIEASAQLEQARKAEDAAREQALHNAADEARKQQRRAAGRTRIAAIAGTLAGLIGIIAIVLIVGAQQQTTQANNGMSTANAGVNIADDGISTANAGATAANAQVVAAQTRAYATLIPIQQTAVALQADSVQLLAAAASLYLDNAVVVMNNNPALGALLSLRAAKGFLADADRQLTLAMNKLAAAQASGHSYAVTSVAFSPDGRYVLTGTSNDDTAQLWDAATGHNLRVFNVSGGVSNVAFSEDGRYALTGSSYDKTARWWDIATGKQVRTFDLTASTSDPYDYVNSVAFSPDQRFILSGYRDGTARLWNISTGQTVRIFGPVNYNDSINRVAFSQDGRFMVTGSQYGTVRLWDVATGQMLHILSGHTSGITSVAFSPDDRFILTGSYDNTARLWDAATGQALRVFFGHTSGVNTVAFSPDRQTILTGSSDGTIQLWNMTTGQRQATLTDRFGIYSAAFSAHGRTILFGDDNATAQIWDLGRDQLVRMFNRRAGYSTSAVAFSSNGQLALTGGADGIARLWDAATGKMKQTFSGHSSTITSVAFSPDNRYVLTGSQDLTARLWDINTGQMVRMFSGHSSQVNSIVFSPDGRMILTGSSDGTARLWDSDSGQLLHIYDTSRVSSVAFSPDGRTFLSGSYDGTARLWDTISGQVLRVFNAGSHANIYSIAFSPDGREALLGGATVQLWDIATARKLRDFVGHTTLVYYSVAFSSDGRYVLTGNADNTIRLWDVATGQTLRTFIGHSAGVQSVQFAPDGRTILSGSADGTARIWDVASGQEIHRFIGDLTPLQDSIAFSNGQPQPTDYQTFKEIECGLIGRDFTTPERTQYPVGPDNMCPSTRIAPSPTLAVTFAGSELPTFTPSQTATPVPADANTPTPSDTPVSTATPSITVTLIIQSSYTAVNVITPTPSDTLTPTSTLSYDPTQITRTPYPSRTYGPSPTITPTISDTPGGSATIDITRAFTNAPDPTATASATVVPNGSTPVVVILSPTISDTPVPTIDPYTLTWTPSPYGGITLTPVPSNTRGPTPTIVITSRDTPMVIETLTATPVSPTATNTPETTDTGTVGPSPTLTNTPTLTMTATLYFGAASQTALALTATPAP